MAKDSVVYRCQQCGHEASRWAGRCPSCGEWNTLTEEFPSPPGKRHHLPSPGAPPVLLTQVESLAEERISTGFRELDRVLGGGLVPGSVVLVGGDPGVGKSTLLLQVSANLVQQGYRCLYLSGEESPRQIRLRAERLKIAHTPLALLAETNVERLERVLEQENPDVLMVDSIQTLFLDALESAPGTVTQVRECAAWLSRWAKARGLSVLVVGHVTKEGFLAGPKVMEHIVDTVLYLEGDRHQHHRLLRAAKNRFGSTNEIGLFAMTEQGLQEIENPSQFLLSQRPLNAPGSVIVCTIEGTRPLLVEVQALVSPSHLSVPRRVATGVDFQRLNLVIAVLEKRARLRMGHFDVYVNVAGGVKVEEPAADLAIALAIASSLRDVPLDPHLVAFGELGLAGEVRAVSHTERRLQEIARLGYTLCLLPARSEKVKIPGLEILPVATVQQALEDVLFIAKGVNFHGETEEALPSPPPEGEGW